MSSALPSNTPRRGALSRILRSASFRLTLIYAALFVISAIVLFGTVYVTATSAMQSDMQAVLRTEAFQLAEIHRRVVASHAAAVGERQHLEFAGLREQLGAGLELGCPQVRRELAHPKRNSI